MLARSFLIVGSVTLDIGIFQNATEDHYDAQVLSWSGGEQHISCARRGDPDAWRRPLPRLRRRSSN